MTGLGTVVVGMVMVVGLVGTVVPVLPGLSLIWAAGLAYGLVDGFGPAGTVALSAMTLLALAGVAAKLILPSRAGSARGASTSTLGLAAALGVVGFVVIPGVGLVVGALAGVLLGEYRRCGDWAAARSSTRAVLIGFGLGALAEAAAAAAMIAAWVVWVAVG